MQRLTETGNFSTLSFSLKLKPALTELLLNINTYKTFFRDEQALFMH